jgi:hypothetical protein
VRHRWDHVQNRGTTTAVSVLLQITLGSAMLFLCLALHIAMQVWLVRRLRAHQDAIKNPSGRVIFIACSTVTFFLLLSHTVHLYIWALSLWVMGALQGHEEPIYFALVTYTTVGYGDTTLGPAFRIYGAMASVTGILAFGLTTAFLVGLFPKIIVAMRDDPHVPLR